MIRVSTKNLEQVKENPAVYAAALVSAGKAKLKRGMFSQWQSVAKDMHVNDILISDAEKKLMHFYSSYNDTERNRQREAFFLKALPQYHNLFSKRGFAYEDGNHIMRWPLHRNVILGGYTPWIVKKRNEYFSYLFTEQAFDWEKELRFPLLQQYISKQIIGCKASELQVGVYCLSDNAFEFRNFSPREILRARNETRNIFERLNSEYIKIKTTGTV